MKWAVLSVVLSGCVCSGVVLGGVVVDDEVWGLASLGHEIDVENGAAGFGWETGFTLCLTDGFYISGRSLDADEVEAGELRLAELCSSWMNSRAASSLIAPINAYTVLDPDELVIDEVLAR